MNALRTVRAFARADFLERARRTSFLGTLGAVAALAYAVHAGLWTVRLGRFFVEPGPGWTGTLVVLATVVPLSLLGFYVVRGTVQRDRRTGVGPVLVATPSSRVEYALGKFASNVAVLGAMLGLLAALAVAMEAYRTGSLTPVGAWRVVSPSLLLTGPALVVIAGLAVAFDSTPGLRGTVGNVVYFSLWAGLLTFGGFDAALPSIDVFGIGLVRETMEEALRTAYPGVAPPGITIQIAASDIEEAGRFSWSGIGWEPAILARRSRWMAVGGVLAGSAAVMLRLFDPFRDRERRLPTPGGANFEPESENVTTVPARVDASDGEGTHREQIPRSSLAPARASSAPVAFVRALRGEVRLMLRGHRWWWYVGLAGANVAALFASPDAVGLTLVAAWLLPVSAWSSLGCRERLHGTEPLLFAAPRPRARQMPAQWAAGIAVAVLAAIGPLSRWTAAGDLHALAVVGAGAVFVPALALCLGSWTGREKTFEGVYLLLWYLGPVNGIPALDFTGLTAQALGAGATPMFLAAGTALAALGWIGRGRRLREAR